MWTSWTALQDADWEHFIAFQNVIAFNKAIIASTFAGRIQYGNPSGFVD